MKITLEVDMSNIQDTECLISAIHELIKNMKFAQKSEAVNR